MKYLDAKRRLIFMMATIRYLRIIFKDNIVITDEQLETIIRQSLPIVFPDCTIRTEDITTAVTGISGILKFNNNKSKIKQYAAFETIVRDRIEIEDQITVKDLIKVVETIAKVFKIKYKPIEMSDLTVLNAQLSNPIKCIDSEVKTYEDLTVILSNITYMASKHNFNTLDEQLLVTAGIKSIATGIISKIKTKSNTAIDLNTILPSKVAIDEKILINDYIETINAIGKEAKIEGTTKTKDILNIEFLKTLSVKINSISKVPNYLDLVTLYPDLTKVNDYVFTKSNISIEDLESAVVAVNNKLKMKEYVNLILINFIALPFEITTKLNMFNVINVEDTVPDPLQIDSKFGMDNNINIRMDESRLIKHSYDTSVNDYLKLKLTRFALVEDWDNETFGNLNALSLNNLIYIEN